MAEKSNLKKGKLYRLARNGPHQRYIAGGVELDSFHNAKNNVIKDTIHVKENVALICISDKPVGVTYDSEFGEAQGEDHPDKDKFDYQFLYGDRLIGLWEDELDLIEEWI